MKLILVVITVATIAGLISGGRFRFFPSIPLGWWSLAIVGVALQFVPVTGDTGYWALLGSFVMLLAFAALNVRAPGFILILTGLFLNTIVIVANHGMPVTREALVRSGQEATLADLREHGGAKHHLAEGDATLLALGDATALPQPIGQAVSAGDLCVHLGVAWCVIASLRPREPRTTRV